MSPQGRGHELWNRVVHRNHGAYADTGRQMQRERDLYRRDHDNAVPEQSGMRLTDRVLSRMHRAQHDWMCARAEVCRQHLCPCDGTV